MEYGITVKPSTLGNPTTNVVLEWIHQVLGKLARACNNPQTYIDKDDPWLGILDAGAFEFFSTINRLKGYSPGQLVFGRDMSLLIKHNVDWEIFCQKKQKQINKDNIPKNIKRVYHDYKVGVEVMFDNHAAYKYETPYKGPFLMTRCWTDGAVPIQYGPIQSRLF